MAYKIMGPTTDGFVHLSRTRKIEVMGPNKWVDVEKNVSKAQAISMLNFKECPKCKMLKVQLFKHPDIAHHLFDRILVAYSRLPWNDEVPHYFARFFYAEFFLNMRPYYTDLPSKYYGAGKGRTYNQRDAFRDPLLPQPPAPLVPRLRRFVTLPSELEVTSQISPEVRGAIGKSLQLDLVGIDVGMN